MKGTVSRDFLLLVFLMNQFPPASEYPIRTISNDSKIRGDIRKSRCTTSVNDTVANLPSLSTTPGANFATSFASVFDTGGKFATGVNDTGSKLAAGVNDTGGKKWEQYQAAETLK